RLKRNADTIVFTLTGEYINCTATAKSITVDWGDGKTDKYDDLDSTEVSHTYAGEAAHTVGVAIIS
ncbi:MAG: hypothetical protein LBH90_09195, partial [Tannerella sp.]|nr:hypothetical protein [Tannerella sp.]